MAVSKIPLVEGEIYHIYSKSIAEFEIFRNKAEYGRMKDLLGYYKIEHPPLKFSIFRKIKDREKQCAKQHASINNLVDIIAYCLMPTHIHLILKQLKKDGISIFMSKALNSYTRYFNLSTKRKGPLWESRFNRGIVKSNEQILHLTRYIHLNPVTAHLVDNPRNWPHSSYREYLSEVKNEERSCNFSEVLDITPQAYEEFVTSQIEYQRKLATAKKTP
ncbi:MAG: transposase [Candidatus Omnitrophica bacterium]|nr:transposase [Candidatus Omnitrophota bacterium]